MVRLVAVSPSALLGLLSAAVGASTCALVYRSTALGSDAESPDLVRPFLATVGVFTACSLLFLVGIRVLPPEGIAATPLVVLVLLFVPWSVFAFRYSGRGYLVTPIRVAVGSLLSVGVFGLFLLQVFEVAGRGEGSVVALLTSVLLLVVLAVVFVAGGFVLLSTYRHASLRLRCAGTVLLPIVVLMIAAQTVGFVHGVDPALLLGATYAAIAVTFPVGVVQYDVLGSRPGTGSVGERTAVDTMNQTFLVTGRRGDIVRWNRRATDLFGADLREERLSELLGATPDALRDQETVEYWSEDGRILFDPQVSTLTDDRGSLLGHTVTLFDVTDREIRRQRLQVLNRILRHNIRNELSAIQARAELVMDDDRPTEDQARKIVDLTDELEGLSAEARRIEKLIQNADSSTSRTALDTFVASVVADVTDDWNGGDVEVDVPSATVSLDRGLLRYALRNVVENAVEHGARSSDGEPSGDEAPTARRSASELEATYGGDVLPGGGQQQSQRTQRHDSTIAVRGRVTDDGVRIVVADDGPGIPEAERYVIESGDENPHAHASSLGLWGTNWAVQTLGGTLSFDESDLGGAAVTIDLPAGVEDPSDEP